MGRKLAGQLLALAFLLAAIYGQQQIFAKEEPAERPLPYEIAFEEPDGWDGCYTVRPQVTITHPGPAGETVYVLEHDGGAGAQGRICEAGGQAVIGQEQFAEGVNRLRVWMEYAPPAEDEEPGAEETDKEEPGAEEPGAEEPDKEEPGAEEPGAEEPDTEGAGHRKNRCSPGRRRSCMSRPVYSGWTPGRLPCRPGSGEAMSGIRTRRMWILKQRKHLMEVE